MLTPPRGVDLWLIPTDRLAPHGPALFGLLDASERQRALAIADPGARRRFTIAHGAARRIVAGYTGRPASTLRWRHGPHGKPELVDFGLELAVSLTHCEELAVFAVARGRAVGVDLERLPTPAAAVRLARRFFPPADAAQVGTGPAAAARFARLWTRKEAFVKALGGRLVEGLRRPVAGPCPLVTPAGPGRAACRITDLPPLGRYRAAVALTGAAGYPIELRRWNSQPRSTSTLPRTRHVPGSGRVPGPGTLPRSGTVPGSGTLPGSRTVEADR
ncbi:4'-phosphopantetheinyl transferase family protein [Kitasatospora sp. LaBMicrA B282]|uniref:4'-phosphopantetheinyl transferase family protein n=1 Tax=Kitasatospora sp. LaBMicrA B282 TaxID=3420949 RepID=UPI003D0F5B04